ncbi:DUF445 domain-containing protein [Sphingobacteriales bacterium UPWRP_1]|nr:hypothetical protein B6N25_09340 [Sphingobacteriales bacterium TSM_CSS]PSJ77486.1 DUF445 domain-containing protein [Sphingobacteriales bacterium UPWRP_1]
MVYTLPFIAAFIGWLTNWIAVKMLFHPQEKVTLLFFEFQGVFPKRKTLLAEKLGQIVSKELISFAEIKNRLNQPNTLTEVEEVVNRKLDEFLWIKLPALYPMMSLFLTENLKQQFKSVAMAEIEEMLPRLIEGYIAKAEKNLDIERIVYNKVCNFSNEKLEQILFAILSKEFRFIELVGGVLGFLIGLVQLLLAQWSF